MKRHSLSLSALVLTLGASVVAPAATAFAHAGLDSSTPAANSVLEAPPSEIVLDFDETVEVSLAQIEVYDGSGASLTVGTPRRGGDDTIVTAPLPTLDDGLYGVVWRTSSVDGHAVSGSFAFQVGTAGDLDPATFLDSLGSTPLASAAVRWSHTVARWVAFVGLVLLLGSGMWAVWSGAALRLLSSTQRLTWAGWVMLWVGSVVTFVLHGAEAHAGGIGQAFDPHSWNDMLSTRTGVLIVLRMILSVALGLLLSLGLHRSDRLWRWSALAASLMTLMTFSGAGHASSADPALLWQLVDLVHLGGVVVWVGGLAVFGAASTEWYEGDESGGAITRFSRWSTIAVPVVAITGVVTAREYSDGFSDITATGWGRALLVKVVLVAVLVAVGGVSRWMLRHHGAASIRRTVVAEAVAGILVLALVAGMVGESPRQPTPSRSYAAQLAAGGLIAAVSVGPGQVGANDLHVVITPQGGSLDAVVSAEARVSDPSAGLPPSPVALVAEGPNHYSGAVTFPVSGEWLLEIIVDAGSGQSVLLSTTVSIP